jgi:hypothetical protein
VIFYTSGLEVLKMKSTLTTLENYLERAVKDDLNIVEVLSLLLFPPLTPTNSIES